MAPPLDVPQGISNLAEERKVAISVVMTKDGSEDRDPRRTSRPLGSSMKRGAGKWSLTWKRPDERLSQRVYSCRGYCRSSCCAASRSLRDDGTPRERRGRRSEASL